MQEEVQFLRVVLVQHGRSQFVEQPHHYEGSEDDYEPTGPGLVFVYVFYYVDFRLQTAIKRVLKTQIFNIPNSTHKAGCVRFHSTTIWRKLEASTTTRAELRPNLSLITATAA